LSAVTDSISDFLILNSVFCILYSDS
jgi:hypothetical protein